MTHFDAHKLEEGATVADPSGREREGRPVAVKVKAKWTNATRQIIKVKLRGYGNRWFDATALELVK